MSSADSSPVVTSIPTLIGREAPSFSLEAIEAGQSETRRFNNETCRGIWQILIFYPRDFSFVCPTELTAFSAREEEFRSRQCKLLGISVDTLDLHREWLATPPQAGGLGPLRYPLASDPDGHAARAFGIWNEEKEVSLRGLFIIDPEGVLQYSVVHNLSVGRSPDEVLRVLDALQNGGLCPVSWTRADGTIDAESALQPGRILGHYRIEGPLGMGTFGQVLAAWDLRLDRPVALKVLKENHTSSRDVLLAEARSAARLNHPHVCTIYSVDEEDGLPLIVMERLEGRQLSDVIADGMSPETAMRLAKEIAAGLAAAHQQEIVHGDLKPANIMVTTEGHAKILDFGLSSRRVVATVSASSADDSEATTLMYLPLPEGKVTVSGTPAYMSPEQAMGQPATFASDVFAFGLVLYELISGRRALSDSSPLAVLMKLRTATLADELSSQLDGELRPLLAAILTDDPAQRPSMQVIVQQLATIRS